MARTKTTKTDSDFTVLLRVNGTEYSATAATVEEAVLALPHVKPSTKGTIIISRNGKESTPIVLTLQNLNRLFYPGMTGDIHRASLAKRFALFS